MIDEKGEGVRLETGGRGRHCRKIREPNDYPNFRSSSATWLSETLDSIVNIGCPDSAQRFCFFNLTHFAGVAMYTLLSMM